VPALPGVPPLARLATPAIVAAGATVGGLTAAVAAQLGLPATIALGSNAFYSGLGLTPLNQTPPQPQSLSQAANASPSVSTAALPPYGISIPGATPNNQINLAVVPDSVLKFAVDADSDLNTHPIEQGQFEAYNRVQKPISIRMLMACQGKNMPRKTFLTTLESLKEGTQIVTVSSPDASYPNMALKGYGYRKEAQDGAVTVYADTVWLEERSTNVVVSSPPTSQPQGAPVSNLGSMTPVDIAPTVVTAQYQGASIATPSPSGYTSTAAILAAVTPTPAPLPALYSATAPPSGYAW
jgi:hypothetical protein